MFRPALPYATTVGLALPLVFVNLGKTIGAHRLIAAAAAAAATAHALTSVMMLSLISLIIAGGVAVAVFRFINTGIFAVYRSQRFGRPLLSDWRESLTYQWSSNLLSAPLAIALAAIGRIGNMWLGLSLTAAYALILPIVRQEYAYYNRSREMLDETVEAVVRALEGADPAARAHGDRVSALAVETGRRMRMSERELMALRLASRLHDVGLLAGPDGPDMEQHHAVTGGRVLAQFPDPLIGEFVRAHHERWDGEGIPDHLQGRAIPLGARILAAAEIYDSAQTGLSPFEKPLTREEASRYLTGLAGTALDPQAVAALLSVAAEQDQHPMAAR